MNYELRYVGNTFQIVNATIPLSKAEQGELLERQILELADLNLSLREIGRRVEKSHERVRQIMANCGLTSKARPWKRNANWAEKKCLEFPLYEFFTQALFERGIAWAAMVGSSGDYALMSRLMVGAKVVQLCKLEVRKSGYISLYPKRKIQADIFAVYVPDHGWLIFPAATMPAKATMFSLTPRISGRKDARHDYASYLNKWEIFTEVKR